MWEFVYDLSAVGGYYQLQAIVTQIRDNIKREPGEISCEEVRRINT
jgi:hypothetical protein